MKLAVTVWIALALAFASEQAAPVGLVVEVGSGATLVRANSSLPILAKPADVLFAGDSLRGPAVVVACGATENVSFAAGVQVRKSQPCILPPQLRSGSSVSIGSLSTRSLLVDAFETPPLQSEIPSLASAERLALDRELASFRGDGLYERIARAEVLARRGLAADAAHEYADLRRDRPEASELATSRLFVLEEIAARKRAPKPDPTAGGKTYALLIGISEFQNAQIRSLKYAHEDALLFENFLKSPRGGALPEGDITVLTNQQATTAAIRTAFNTILARASQKDTVLVLLATHGAVVENPRSRSRGAYIVTYDSDPEDLGSTALPMAAVQKFIREDLAKTARVLAFVDACRSGTIGTIPDKSKMKINAALDSLTQTDLQLFLFTASRPGEVSYEGRQYGGGHGAFSFFLLEAMNGAADFDSDSKVTVNEMVTYVQQKVAEATVDKQHPREGGTLDTTVRVADTSKPGIDMGTFQPGAASASDVARSFGGISQRETAVRIINIRQAVDFDEALAAGRVLPDQSANAFTALRQLKLARRLNHDQLVSQENRLRTALEDQNQQALLKYLKGDQSPTTKEEYVHAARMVSAAIQINGETPALVSRLLFCEGRAAIFDKQYAQARSLLEKALRLDSEAPYIYNALGTAYLEQGEFDLASHAIEEAIERAPLWAYPRHNLALLLDQQGDSERAIRVYDDAIRLAPQHSYLVYNQGLLYQKLNRKTEAEARYRRATEMSPKLAAPYNALGTLRVEQGRLDDAEWEYRKALSQDSSYVEARQNLASLIARQPRRREEAVLLWRENLQIAPDFLPSRLSLAQTLKELGQNPDAISEYSRVIQQAPDLTGARLRLAQLFTNTGDRTGAKAQLEEARLRDPANPIVLEGLADYEASGGQTAEASSLYRAALAASADSEQRKRISSKLRGKSR